MITPAGAPVWSRTSDHTTYGGDVNKHNYQSRGAVNPLTDVTAEQFTRLAADVSAVAKTVDFATITFRYDTASGLFVVYAYDAMAGAAPVPTHFGVGQLRLTWLASYADDYGVSSTIDIRHCDHGAHGAAAAITTVQLEDNDANGKNEALLLHVWDAAGAPADDITVTLTVSTS
jgi:hypothetical protein